MTPPLPLPTLAHVAAFRTIVGLLRNSPYLKPVVKTWRVWDGDPASAQPPAIGHAPWVRLTPGADGGDWITANQQRIPLLVRVETFTQGLNVDDSLNLWGAIAAALFPGDQSVATALGSLQNGAVAPAIRLQMPAFPAHTELDKLVGLHAEGLISLPVNLATQS